jgi:hypothetical protein
MSFKLSPLYFKDKNPNTRSKDFISATETSERCGEENISDHSENGTSIPENSSLDAVLIYACCRPYEDKGLMYFEQQFHVHLLTTKP